MTGRLFGKFLALPLAALTAAAIFSSGCSYKREKGGDGGSSDNGVATGAGPHALDTANLSYALMNEQIFVPKCLQCHNSANAKGGYVLDSYASVKAHLSEIDKHVLVKKDMPRRPVAPLSATQEGALEAWIHSGAPEFANQPAPANPGTPVPTPTDPNGDTRNPSNGTGDDCRNRPPAPEEYRWAALKKGLLEQNCFRCHDSDDASSGLGLATPTAMREHIDDVLSLAVIKRRMPPKHPLTDEQQDLLLKWVRHGMQE